MRTFGLQYALGIKNDPSRPMGNVGLTQINLAIEAWLVGFEKEISPVLPRALEWVGGAIEGGESFGESLDFHRQNLWWGKAVALWMLNDSADVEAWERARWYHAAAAEEDLALIKENAPRTVFSKEHFSTCRLDDYLALCVEAQQYALGIEEFEKYHEPASLQVGRIKQPRELGYIICMHALGRGYDAEAVFQAGQRVLRAHLDSAWLSKGQFIRAATWLKIVYSIRDEKLTALEMLQKAHDYL